MVVGWDCVWWFFVNVEVGMMELSGLFGIGLMELWWCGSLMRLCGVVDYLGVG